jgi:hypothetical protein
LEERRDEGILFFLKYERRQQVSEALFAKDGLPGKVVSFYIAPLAVP